MIEISPHHANYMYNTNNNFDGIKHCGGRLKSPLMVDMPSLLMVLALLQGFFSWYSSFLFPQKPALFSNHSAVKREKNHFHTKYHKTQTRIRKRASRLIIAKLGLHAWAMSKNNHLQDNQYNYKITGHRNYIKTSWIKT